MGWGWTARLSLFVFIIAVSVLFSVTLKELRHIERRIVPWGYYVLWVLAPMPSAAFFLLSNLAGSNEARTKPRWRYPRYVWDVSSWWIVAVAFWILMIVHLGLFFWEHGIASSPSFSAPVGDPETNDYVIVLLVAAVITYISLFGAMDAFWAEALNAYDLLSVPKFWVKKRTVTLLDK
jgi:hypothetical protein